MAVDGTLKLKFKKMIYKNLQDPYELSAFHEEQLKECLIEKKHELVSKEPMVATIKLVDTKTGEDIGTGDTHIVSHNSNFVFYKR